jgi:hypothetical protein
MGIPPLRRKKTRRYSANCGSINRRVGLVLRGKGLPPFFFIPDCYRRLRDRTGICQNHRWFGWRARLEKRITAGVELHPPLKNACLRFHYTI